MGTAGNAVLFAAKIVIGVGFNSIAIISDSLNSSAASKWGGVMAVKLGMHLVARTIGRKARSTALLASATDHRNDVLVSAAVILGVGASELGYPIFDPLAAMTAGAWIIWAGFRIGRDNTFH